MNWSKKSVINTLLASVLVLLTSLSVRSQNFRRIEKDASENFNQGNFVAARDQYKELFEADWNKNVTASLLASCYLELDKPVKSYEVLSQITEPDGVNSYLMILTQFYLEDFDEAERLIEEFNEKDTTGFDVQAMADKIEHAKLHYATNEGILVQNFGDAVNSEDLEYSAIMYNDYNELLFTSRKEDGTVTDVDGLAYENIFYTSLDDTDNWVKAEPFDIEVRQSRSHDATVQFLPSKQKMILYQDGQLYTATKKGNVWSKDSDLILHEKVTGDTHCYMFPDEKTIIFASDYASEGEHIDLFISHKQSDGSWSEPDPIEELNTDMDEDSPFLAGDSTLYFSSNGHNSIGGYDVYRSKFDHEKGIWGTPENMGYPINTVSDDIYYTTEGKLAYLSSTRMGGKGSLDLYRVFLFNRVKVQGRLLANNKQPVSDADIDIRYENTHLQSHTDANGNYELFVPVNTKMHVTFLKDSLNLVEGDYIANITFKDENNNEFNFFIDYADDKPEIVDENQDEMVVNNLNIEVRNDLDNPILASVPPSQEKNWADSLNLVAARKRQNTRETFVTRQNEQKADLESGSLNIREATITQKKQDVIPVPNSSSGGYTVQILAMPAEKRPDKSFFDNLDSAPIHNTQGRDGLNRYYTGKYNSKEDALEVMRLLRRAGYFDAFIRKLDRYAEL